MKGTVLGRKKRPMNELFSKQSVALYGAIWEKLEKGEPLTEDAAMIAEAMTAHPELNPFWSLGEAAFQPQEIGGCIVNPLVHVGLHVAIEKQLERNDPEEVAAALSRLIERGLDRHEAIHQIAAIWGDLYFRSVRRGGPFDEWEYMHRLSELGVVGDARE